MSAWPVQVVEMTGQVELGLQDLVRECPNCKMFLRSLWYRAGIADVQVEAEMHIYTLARSVCGRLLARAGLCSMHTHKSSGIAALLECVATRTAESDADPARLLSLLRPRWLPAVYRRCSRASHAVLCS